MVLVILSACVSGLSRDSRAGQPFKPTWESLSAHTVPEWFRDAKFGIYTHWGPVTVGAEDGPNGVQWYGRSMYLKESPVFEYHREHYGDQKKFGYKDMIALFRATKFDADQWAAIFAASGAKFAGPVAIHHDNFAMWDSAITQWDAVDNGPHLDITGELANAIRRHGMKFIATFHHAFSWRYFEPSFQYDGKDPRYADLYLPHTPGAPPSRRFLDRWLALVDEVVQKYEPDMIWFDFGLGSVITPEYQRRMFADYYNWAAAKGVAVAVAHKHRDIHKHTGILDFERGREDRLTPYPWLTDTSVGPWFRQKSVPYKTVDQIVDVLVDIVAKNGCMLLNVGPAADGTIPPEAEKLLRGVGDWLKVNGTAIYSTRPWLTYGEGPTRQEKGGGFSERRDRGFTNKDIRFTRSKDGATLFVIVLGWPDQEITVRSMKISGHGSVKLLGSDQRVDFQRNDAGQLVIKPPRLSLKQRPCRHAYVFQLTGFAASLHPDACFDLPAVLHLEPAKAVMEGCRVNVQVSEGRENIGYWDLPREKVHWLAYLERPGRWRVRGEFSCAGGPSSLRLNIAGADLVATVPRTHGWFHPELVTMGDVTIDKPGVYHLVLEPADADTWKPVNVYQLQLAPAEPLPAHGSVNDE